ncbi:MAG: hypothetical protein HYT87_07385 [Nitrospirae bacterium]|nr:hypothetical protein [Nitrospirota bacterium]
MNPLNRTKGQSSVKFLRSTPPFSVQSSKEVGEAIRRVLRAMDYVSEKWLRGKPFQDGRRADLFYNIYQELGTAWHYYGLQCRHPKGYRRIGGGQHACRTCGQIKGTSNPEYLLPAKGRKRIGRFIPSPRSSGAVRKHRTEATLLDDEIGFHGTKLAVRVNHAYESRWAGGKINIASDRSIRLREGEIEAFVDDHLAGIRFLRRSRGDSRRKRAGRTPVYGGFAYELPRRLLRKFPVIFSYDPEGRLLEIEVFRSEPHGRAAKR